MGNPILPLQSNEVERAARSLGIQPQLLDVRNPEDLPRAFDKAATERAEGLVVALDGLTQGDLRRDRRAAAKGRLPSIYATKEYVDLGGLMSYGASDVYMYHRAAMFIDKILKGVKPADIAVEQPAKFELAVNLRTAKALGLAVPPSLLLRADMVIE